MRIYPTQKYIHPTNKQSSPSDPPKLYPLPLPLKRESTLKTTSRIGLITRECNLGHPWIQLIDNLPIDNLTHLIILLDCQTTLITRPI